MVIKKKVNASEVVLPVKPGVEPTVVEELQSATTPIIDYKACAIEHIMEAIKCLSNIADTDETAKDSIANLAVITFDLK